MAFYKSDIVDVNLEVGKVFRSFAGHTLGDADVQADRFGIRAFRNGVPQDLGGSSCQALFTNANGTTYALTSNGTVSGNEAYVTLPSACYQVNGPFMLAIRLSGGGVTGTMRIVDGMVVNTHATESVVTPYVVPTYSEILAQYDAMIAATAAANGSIARAYASLTFPVKAGTYCIYDGDLYVATQDISTTEAFNVLHWAGPETLGDNLTGLASTYDDVFEIYTIYSRNLNKTPFPTPYTEKGVTFTSNSDGSITLSCPGGSPTGNIFWPTVDTDKNWYLPAGTYTLSGGRAGCAVTILGYDTKTSTSVTLEKSSGASAKTFTTDRGYWVRMRFDVLSTSSPNGVTLYPQIEAGSTKTDYQDPSWHENHSTVIDNIEAEVSGYGEDIEELQDKVNDVVTYEVGKNLCPPEHTTGGVQSNGTIDPDGAWASYGTSDFIELEANTDYVFSCFGSVQYMHIQDRMIALLYDSDKNPLSDTYQNVSGTYSITFNPGSTAKYVRVCSKNAYLFQVEKGTTYSQTYEAFRGRNVMNLPLGETPMEQVRAGNILYGKKWAVCGDSFTDGATDTRITGNGKYAGQKYVYPYLIGNRNEMDILKFFNGGETLAFPANPGSFTNSLTYTSGDRYYQNIPSDVDYITIYLGINDSSHASGSSQDGEETTGVIPLGTIDDSTTATYYGAWNVVLTWLITNRPNAHIGIIVTNGVASNDNYRLAQIAIATKYGIPYIDLNGDARTPAMIRTSNPNIPATVKNALIAKWRVSESNTHPNDAAHLFESTFIENFLRSI